MVNVAAYIITGYVCVSRCGANRNPRFTRHHNHT